MEEIQKFGKYAGLTVNKCKSNILTMNLSKKEDKEIKQKFRFQLCKKIKYLGITL